MKILSIFLICIPATFNQPEMPKAHVQAAVESERTYQEVLGHLPIVKQELKSIIKINPDSGYRLAANVLNAYICDSLFPYWAGTPWEFYGKTLEPKKGTIACGYFVTTLLSQLGQPIDRIALAEDYSENMIKALVNKSVITKFYPFQLNQFIESVKKKGNGLYVIGLDRHTGFISCREGEVKFIHSSFYAGNVIQEEAVNAYDLQINKYGVIGCLTSDRMYIDSWLGK